jgi:hypothetical protein
MMSVKVCTIAVLFSASLVVGGCRGDDQRTLDPRTPDDPVAESAWPGAPGAQQQQEARVTGQIDHVDTERGTFTVTSAGMEHRFMFSADTEVIGAAGTQGLASAEGNWVTVYFQDLPEGRRAVRIELDEMRR